MKLKIVVALILVIGGGALFAKDDDTLTEVSLAELSSSYDAKEIEQLRHEKRKHQVVATVQAIALTGYLWAAYKTVRYCYDALYALKVIPAFDDENDDNVDAREQRLFNKAQQLISSQQASKRALFYFPLVLTALAYCCLDLGLQLQENLTKALEKIPSLGDLHKSVLAKTAQKPQNETRRSAAEAV